MVKPSKPRTLQELHNEKLKEICESFYSDFEGLRTTAAINKTYVDFLKAIASNLGVKPTVKAKLHSKKRKRPEPEHNGEENEDENRENDN